MTDEFGKSGDDPVTQNEGSFGTNNESQTTTDSGSQGIDFAEYEALRKRDEHAQAHIERLERENEELRDKYTALEDKLSKATTLDDALARMQNQGEGQAIDRADVAQVVAEVLGQERTQARMESNWAEVTNKLTEVFGDWTTADAKVQERARELDISVQDATSMAKKNPKAFLQLFAPQSKPSATARSSGTGEVGQRGVSTQGETRDQSWWNNLRRKDPNKYWSVEMQAMMRRDLFND